MQHKSISVWLTEILVPFTLFLTPLLFLPFFSNFFGTPKQILIVAIVLMLLMGLVLDMLLRRTIPLRLSSLLLLPLMVCVGAVITNLIANPEGRTEALVGSGSLYLALAILSYFLSMLPRTTKLKSHSVIAIIASSTSLALHGILQLTFLHRWNILPGFMQEKGFTLSGSPFITVSILMIGSVVAFVTAKNLTSARIRYLTIACGIISLGTALAYGSLMLPGGPLTPTILPFAASWNITLDALKNAHTVFFGVGIANFSSLYTAVKPPFLNATPFWNMLPTNASTEIFQWMTTMGALGTAAFIYLIARGVRQITDDRSEHSPISIIFIGSALTFFFTPGSVPIYLLFFVSFGILKAERNEHKAVQQSTRSVISLVLAVAIGLSGYFLVQAVRAENLMYQATQALTKKDATKTYDAYFNAVRLAPTMTNYRLSYAQINLSLAAGMMQKSDITDAEKETINHLVTQAINEGKAASVLRPHDVRVWQNLGAIYANLIPIMTGADTLALDAYNQAVALDANNPALRTEFGAVLMQLVRTTKDEQVQSAYLNRANAEFQTAIQLKSDYSMAYYNLAKLLESVGEYGNATLAMQKSVSLLKDTDPNLARAKEELSALKAKVPQPTPTPKIDK